MKAIYHLLFLGILSLGQALPQPSQQQQLGSQIIPPEQLAPQLKPEHLAPQLKPEHLAPLSIQQQPQLAPQHQQSPQLPPQHQQPAQLPPPQQQPPQLPPQQQQSPQLPPQQHGGASADSNALFLDHPHSEPSPPQQQYPPPQQQYPPPQQQYPPPQQQSSPPQQQYPPPRPQNVFDIKGKGEREVNTPGGSKGFGKDHNDQAAQLGDFPYKVQVRHNGQFIGGGTLIRSPVTGRQLVLTVAHILTQEGSNGTMSIPINPEQLSVRMGIIYKDDIGQERRVIRNFVHPAFIFWKQGGRPIFNDIAILVPDRPFILNDHVQTLALPTGDWPVAHETVVVKGWGQGREAGHTEVSNMLRFFRVPVWDTYRCDAVFYQESGLDLITKKHFCAGFEDGTKDSCGGDSGAAAMGIRDGVPMLYGIVSWGKGCGTPGYPGVYTKVYQHLDWIKQTMYSYEKFGYL